MKTIKDFAEGDTVWLTARISGPSGDLAVRNYASAAVLNLYLDSGDDPSTPIMAKALSLAAVPPDGCLSDELLTDTNWDEDDDGYNFWAELSPTDYAMLGGLTYRAEVVLTLDSIPSPVFPVLSSYGLKRVHWLIPVSGRVSV